MHRLTRSPGCGFSFEEVIHRKALRNTTLGFQVNNLF
jgi:hypothetical protein